MHNCQLLLNLKEMLIYLKLKNYKKLYRLLIIIHYLLVDFQQTYSGRIENAKITGTVKLGFASILDLSYNITQYQAISATAPISGYISSPPSHIYLNNRVVDNSLFVEKSISLMNHTN